MLNISPNSILPRMEIEKFRAFSYTDLSKSNYMFTVWMIVTFALIVLFLFLPWTQNVQTKGKVTTLRPEHRPQTIHTTIPGRIEKWFVQEGQRVNVGDTILYLSEIKDDYFDPELLPRTDLQVRAKEEGIQAYKSKAVALDNQIEALKQELTFKTRQLQTKIRQLELKITSDSIEWQRIILDQQIAQRQLERTQSLFEQDIKAVTDVEDKKFKIQEVNAKLVAVENKFQVSKNELINAQLELNGIQYSYQQKIAKANSDKFSTLSSLYDAEAGLSKLQIQASNYNRRSSFYYITAPQDCYITKALKTGIGETVKEGTAIVSIMPSDYELAVELYVKAMDLPLIHPGQEVRFIFDGWPAFVFSGWPGFSFGTYKGKVVAIDNVISKDDQYRILVAPDESEGKIWPELLRPGSAAQGIALLQQVPLWYELWRKLNGFPPDFYKDEMDELPKMKAPFKSVK